MLKIYIKHVYYKTFEIILYIKVITSQDTFTQYVKVNKVVIYGSIAKNMAILQNH